MKVLYDHQIFSTQKYGGISRYFSMLINQLEQSCIPYEIPEVYTSNYYLAELAKRYPGKIRVKDVGNSPFSNTFRRYANYRNRIESLRSVSRGDFDIFHPTYYDPYFLARLGDKPLVITVHDMIHEIFPEHFPLEDTTIAWKQELLGRASAIIAVSANTKKDLLQFYEVDEKKIRVIYHGNSMTPTHHRQADPQLPGKYLLFVGDRSLYKNFYFFAESIAPLVKADSALRLVCIGSKPFSVQENAFFKHIGLNNKVEHRQVNDAALACLYRGACAFVFPSLYEGFGIPVLEAFACDCPVILSNTSSLPEIGKNAAVYFDPKDTTSIRDAVQRIINDKEQREKMVSLGRERLLCFSWEKCAQETAEVYRSLVD